MDWGLLTGSSSSQSSWGSSSSLTSLSTPVPSQPDLKSFFDPLSLSEASSSQPSPKLVVPPPPLSPPAAPQAVFSAAVELRRKLHQWPEAGFEEVQTQSALREALGLICAIPEGERRRGVLSSISPPPLPHPHLTHRPSPTRAACIKAVANTGLQVELMGTGAAAPSPKLIALRADMDGLRMEESNMFLPYKSRNPGRAHMCGHDGHMASLVAAAALISSRRHLLPSNHGVRLLFQPAEEGPGGALPMMKEGCLEGVAEVYGVHNWPSIPLGTIHVRPGPVMARVSTWAILVKGRGSHASQPQQALDAISCGAAIIAGVNGIVSRSLSCHARAVVSVTQFHAGDAVNVLPDTAKLEGTIRDFDEETCVPPPPLNKPAE